MYGIKKKGKINSLNCIETVKTGIFYPLFNKSVTLY